MSIIQHDAVAVLLSQAAPIFEQYVRSCADAQGDFQAVEDAARLVIQTLRPALMTSGVKVASATATRDFACPECGSYLCAWSSHHRRVVTAEGEADHHVVRYRCVQCERDYYPLEAGNGLVGS